MLSYFSADSQVSFWQIALCCCLQRAPFQKTVHSNWSPISACEEDEYFCVAVKDVFLHSNVYTLSVCTQRKIGVILYIMFTLKEMGSLQNIFLSFFLSLQVLQVALSAPVGVIILPVLSVLLVNARASLLSGNAMETMTVGTTATKMAAVRIPPLTCVWEN